MANPSKRAMTTKQALEVALESFVNTTDCRPNEREAAAIGIICRMVNPKNPKQAWRDAMDRFRNGDE